MQFFTILACARACSECLFISQQSLVWRAVKHVLCEGYALLSRAMGIFVIFVHLVCVCVCAVKKVAQRNTHTQALECLRLKTTHNDRATERAIDSKIWTIFVNIFSGNTQRDTHTLAYHMQRANWRTQFLLLPPINSRDPPRCDAIHERVSFEHRAPCGYKTYTRALCVFECVRVDFLFANSCSGV